MIRLFVGWDEREEVGTHVFNSSVIHNCSEPVQITHLKKDAVAKEFGVQIKEGSNAFTLSRFLIPALCDYQGWAIFADGADMLCNGDLAQLWELRDASKAVQVVKHNYQTRNPKKYCLTKLESENLDYVRKNWASLMLINCGHLGWRHCPPDKMMQMQTLQVLQFRFLHDEEIGQLDSRWNWLIDEFGPNPAAKIWHWTAGIPAFEHYACTPHSDEWRKHLGLVDHATD